MRFSGPHGDYRLFGIPDGPEGTRATLRAMAAFVREYRSHPQIRELAMRLVSELPSESFSDEIAALHRFVRDHVRYTLDVRDVETVQSPIETLRLMQGDCDDKAVLLAALLESIGHPSRFVAYAFEQPDVYEHVIVETRLGAGWVSLEATKPVEMGWTPTEWSNRMLHHV
ncbi:MAG: transglutaminase-like domain-containing protein [Steroidobacteraceae bacterium]|nr:transglutaminase-like domain-containing protein [Steroidobacteraceae bacterium]MDW8260576.1 transglutaminase-like domain-containing protein [Gammaproteobacteria bacterium]